MIRALLSISLFVCFNTLTFASLNDGSQNSFGYDKLSKLVNGTLSITVDTAPTGGLPPPKILVIRGFIAVYQNNVNWGDTWDLVIPSDTYRIHPLPVSDGTNFYTASSTTAFVPPGGSVGRLITYHII